MIEVKTETIDSVARNVKTDKNYLSDVWFRMLGENREMFISVVESARTASKGDVRRQECFLNGAFMVYALLISQEEADEMNEEWGL